MKSEVVAKKAVLEKAGEAVGGSPTYSITCGKCDLTFSAKIPLHPSYRKAECPGCKTTNKLP